MTDPKTVALPLGYSPTLYNIYNLKFMGRSMGIEPTHVGSTIRCVNHFTTIAINKTGVVGIEPTPKVLETSILPLNYTPIKK